MLLLNIGNSNTQLADYDGEKIHNIRYKSTAKLSVEDCGNYRRIVGSTVVPELKERLKLLNIVWLNNQHAVELGLDLSHYDASTLGADRLANVLAVLSLSRESSAVVFDFGTAITCEVVERGGIFRGGAILPGRKLMRMALNQGTAQLPEVPLLERVPRDLGLDTFSSISFGVDCGVVGAVRELLLSIQHKFGEDIRVISTGGDASFFADAMTEFRDIEPLLTLHGLLQLKER